VLGELLDHRLDLAAQADVCSTWVCASIGPDLDRAEVRVRRTSYQSQV
jgi:hypothetical protein